MDAFLNGRAERVEFANGTHGWRFADGRVLPAVAGGAPTLEELEARQAEIRSRIAEIDQEYAGQRMPEEARSEWNDLGQELNDNEELIEELRTRREFIAEIAGEENEPRGEGDRITHVRREGGAGFNTRPARSQTDNIWDVASVRRQARGPEDEARMLSDNAKRAVEIAVFPHELADQDAVRSHIERLQARFAGEEGDDGYSPAARFARHLLQTGSPLYQRAFGKAITGRPLSADEQRALTLATPGAGYAVPYTLDPTIIPTSNSGVNPVRALARVETIVGSNEWRGVTSGAITASRDGAHTEVSDDTPPLAQPAITVSKVQAFVPFDIEAGQDWGSLQAEMAVLLQDAKDDEEASISSATSGFVTGDGTGDNPQGVVTGAGTVAAGTASYALAHLYKLEESLGARFRQRAQFMADRPVYNLTRQFDTSGGAALWMYLRDGLANNKVGNTGANLIGYPANEATAMADNANTGNKFLLLGDFRYYIVVDRIGMTVELVPHLFGASGRPTGQRGMYAHWRNNGKVLSSNAFKVLQAT